MSSVVRVAAPAGPDIVRFSGWTTTSPTVPSMIPSKVRPSVSVKISEPATKPTPRTIASADMSRRTLRARSEVKVERSIRPRPFLR